MKYISGTSGYSFADWVGPFYPPGTRSSDMLGRYVEHFETVEINFTFYRVPTARTMGCPQNGHVAGIDQGFSSPVRSAVTGPITWGITSPARLTTTVSPISTPLRYTSSSLWRVALVTVTPPTNTGSRTA